MSQHRLRTPADIGALIRDRRRTLQLDQAGLAQMIGASRLWVNQIERGKQGASLGLVLRTLDALGIRLMGDTPNDANTDTGSSAPIITADIDAIVNDARRVTRS